MPTHAALLRAVNLAGRNKLGMTELRTLAEELGLEEARTLLQSGNLVFTPRSGSASDIEVALEKGARARLGIHTDFFVRSEAEWRTLLAANPFHEEAGRDPGHLLVVFLKDAPSTGSVQALEQAIVGREVVRADGRHLYVVYPDGVGRSRLTMALIEKKLGTRGTGRNWNTVSRLARLLEVADP